ncbi:hypothetical protein ScPMuIL_006601 [Solemya velum]
MVDKAMFLVFACVFSATFVQAETTISASVTWNSTNNKFCIHDGIIGGSVASAKFINSINITGWSYLEVTTSEKYEDEMQAYAAGLVEGYITKELIALHWINTAQGYCPEPLTPYCQRLKNFLEKNLDWVNKKIEIYGANDTFWHQVDLVLVQISGITDGYSQSPGGTPVSRDLDVLGFYIFQVDGDFEDLETVLAKTDISRPLGDGHCSALIKLLPGNKDLYVAQDTWSGFQSMLRILKKYDFSYHYSAEDKRVVPGQISTFSSQPGRVMSGDDFYLISSGLASLETTIGNGNSSLWQYVTPESVLEGFRNMAANRLATTGLDWCKTFEQYNSGTYNNEWMIVDYKQFKPGQPPKEGLLYVLEQIPNLIVYDDMTDFLQKQTYWPSYNTAFFPEIFNMSGDQANVDKFGDWFTYDHTPRANIFRRDHINVKDIDSMMKMMRYNDFKHDPLSRCNCTPPYSGENGISARSDLNPANGSYPFGALGHRCHGGTDMKLTNSSMFSASLGFIAISGPTWDSLPPFQWSTSGFDIPHFGHPDVFKFDPVYFDGSLN